MDQLRKDSSLILPGDPDYYHTLATMPPPGVASGGETAFIFRAGSSVMVPATRQEVDDYLYGGEYDDRLVETDDDLDLDDDGWDGTMWDSLPPI